MDVKYKIGFVFILLSILIFVLDETFIDGQKEQRFTFMDEDFDNFDLVDFDNSNDFEFVILLSDKVCSPCLNNTKEYAELLRKSDFDVSLYFVSDNEENANRLLKIMDLEEYYEGITTSFNDYSNILFAVNDSKQVRSISYIPNNQITSTEHKENVLQEHLSNINAN